MTAAQRKQIVVDSAWAKGLRRQAGGIAALLVDGEAELVELGTGVDASTPMELGSVTKGFTGLLLADSLQRGELSLQSRVDEVVFRERWEGEPAITALELATHTSGLPRVSMPWQVGLLGDPYRWYGRNCLMRFLQRNNPRSPTRTKFVYSNLGFAVLGLMLEKAAGKTYAELLQERVLAPLGMTEARLQMVGGGDLVASGYNVFGMRATPWHFKAYAPCGALISTARELLRATEALADPAGPLAGSVALAAQRQVEIPGGSIGLAWLRPKGREWLWHSGGTFGYQSCVGFHPGRRTALVLLANQYGAKPLSELARRLMQEL